MAEKWQASLAPALISSQLCAGASSTLVENSLQIDVFLQNKPNSQNERTNLNHYPNTTYKNGTATRTSENKPKTNPIYAYRSPRGSTFRWGIQTQFMPTQSVSRNPRGPRSPPNKS